MSYIIKGFYINDGALDCRFEFILPTVSDVIEFLSKVDLHENYDYVKVIPYDKEV